MQGKVKVYHLLATSPCFRLQHFYHLFQYLHCILLLSAPLNLVLVLVTSFINKFYSPKQLVIVFFRRKIANFIISDFRQKL
jgi:hypothetical protein